MKKNNIRLNKVEKFQKYHQQGISIDHIKMDDLISLNILNLNEIKQHQVFAIIREPIERFF